MKNIIVICVVFIMSNVLLFSQPVITYSNFSSSFGDVRSYYIADTTGVVPGSNGANQTWNFSSLVVGTTIKSDTIFNPSTSPHSSSFPTATHASTGISVNDDSPVFFSIESASQVIILGYYVFMGTSASSYTLVYTDPVKSIEFPFTYGSSFTDNSAGSYVTNSLNNIVTQTNTTSGDGWGTLILPNHTYNNVLKIKSVTHTSTDVGGYYTSLFDGTLYSWYDGIHKLPILQISNNTMTLGANVISAKNVYVADFATGILDNNIDKHISLYPNPCSDNLCLKLDGQMPQRLEVEICDLTGKVLRVLSYSEIIENIELPMDGIDAGIYLVKIRSDKDSATLKIVKD